MKSKEKNSKNQLTKALANTEVKKIQKAFYYENFKNVAKRLRKEGKLNEENYDALLRSRDFSISIEIFLLIFTMIILAQFNFSFWAYAVTLIIFFGVFYWSKRDVNRLCYLFNFGKISDGEIIDVRKDEQYMSIGGKFGCDYRATYKFRDSKGLEIIIFQNNPVIFRDNLVGLEELSKLIKNKIPAQILEMPEFKGKKTVYYNPKNPYDAVLDSSEFDPKITRYFLSYNKTK